MSLLEWLYNDDPDWYKYFTHDEWTMLVNADLYFSYVRRLDDVIGVPWRHGGFDLADKVHSPTESQQQITRSDMTTEHIHIHVEHGYFSMFSGVKKVIVETVGDTYGAAPADLQESTYGLFFLDDTGGKNFVPWGSIENITEDMDA